MPLPSNLPYPVVFGPSFPVFTMVTKQGRQTFQSRTNHNLFLRELDFTEDGTFTMARLLRLTSTPKECLQLIFDHVYFYEGEPVDWETLLEEPRWDVSEAFTRLIGYSGSESEQRFFREWCRAQYSRGIGAAYLEYRATLEDPVLRFKRFDDIALGFLEVIFDFPALIPETWLNYDGQEKTSAPEQHLAEYPSRVGFVTFSQCRKCVIEIDGPTHYANYDEATRTYSISEERYVKNLAIERSLRRQGWEIYRFASSEVKRAHEVEFVRLITSAQLPGLACSVLPWHTSPYRGASATDLKARLESSL